MSKRHYSKIETFMTAAKTGWGQDFEDINTAILNMLDTPGKTTDFAILTLGHFIINNIIEPIKKEARNSLHKKYDNLVYRMRDEIIDAKTKLHGPCPEIVWQKIYVLSKNKAGHIMFSGGSWDWEHASIADQVPRLLTGLAKKEWKIWMRKRV